ncbi:MAG: chemotaxis response regulator protein-glutamate methylesterase [Pseudomonadales bacterium]|nr:chemotaxis response regulator protein-glutamate methylesterase [Pseudomonadales bacterium]
MKIKVLIVDDSYFFRKRLCDLFEDHPQISVVATAVNGEDALTKVKTYRPDLITMDYEMPVMDGVTAVRRIMESYPTPILMISALTYKGASVTLEALEAGALDFIAKLSNDGGNPFADKKVLCEQILQLVQSQKIRPVATAIPTPTPAIKRRSVRSVSENNFSAEVVVIGASTGGPVAVQNLLAKLPQDFPLPIVVAVHMPANFTLAYANRLAKSCKIGVKEAADRDPLMPGQALIAPGGRLIKICKDNMGFVRLEYQTTEYGFAPSVDQLFTTASESYGKNVLAIVLTGMGSDGSKGAKKLRSDNATVWAQDEESSVIWGMPGVVVKHNLANQVLSLDEMATRLSNLNG